MGKGFPAKIWRETKTISKLLGQQGKLLYFSQVQVGGEGYEKAVPYLVGLIRVNGEVVAGQIVDWEGRVLKKGSQVEAVARRLRVEGKEGLIKYGVCWRITS